MTLTGNENLSLSKNTFTKILEEKIRFGKFQILSLLGFGCIDFMDGVQLLASAILMPVFKNEFQISMEKLSILASCFYLGVFFGATNSGKWGDRLGRRKTSFYGISLQIFFTLCFLLAFEFYTLSFVWFLYGISFGFTVPLTTTMISEITIIKFRGILLLFLNLFVSFGKLYSLGIAYFTLDKNLKGGNWKLYLLLGGLPCLVSLFILWKFSVESPFFLLKMKKFEEAFTSLNFMIKFNNSRSQNSKEVTIEEQECLKEEFNVAGDIENETGVCQLLKPGLRKKTLYFWSMWFFLNIMYFGQLLIIPFVMKKKSKSLGVMAFATLGEIPSIFFSSFLIENKFFGRRYSLIMFFSLACIFHAISCFCPLEYFSVILPIARFFMKCSYSMIYPFTTEAHPTLVRTLAYGWCTAIGKLGGFFMPFIMFALLRVNKTLPFVFMSLCAFIAAFSAFKTGVETRGKNLKDLEQI